MSNRFKNLLKDNTSKNTKKKNFEEPKLKQNSRWQINDTEEKTNRFQSSKNTSYKKNENSNNRNENSNNRNFERNRGRNNFNKKYKAGYKPRKPSGPAPCAADRFGINFSNLEKFDKSKNSKIEMKETVVKERKFIKMENGDDDITEEERKITLALAQQYQYYTESEEEEENDDDDVESVDSIENWEQQHI